jgi:UDP:flavonoid glycosyltransferase YjiC (YdhE family)
LTFGTVLSLAGATLDVFRRVVDALRGEPIRLVVSVGDLNDPAVVGARTDRLIIGRYWPHRLLLACCDAVICHGGAGSTIAALSHGLPLLILPRDGASQYRSAFACAQAGAALTLLDSDVDAASIRRSVRTLIDEGSYRLAAQRIAAEIRLMPAPSLIVPAIERVASDGRIG